MPNFVWANKPPKIKKTTIIGEKKDGGLKMIDFKLMEKSLKISWLNRLQSDSNAGWKFIPEELCKLHGGLNFLIKCNYDTKLLNLSELPTFYLNLLIYWQESRHLLIKGNDNVHHMREIIWHNKDIKINGKSIFYPTWIGKNIGYVKDLLNDNGHWLSHNEFQNKYNLQIPFTKLFGIINAIPSDWKNAIKKSPPDTVIEISHAPIGVSTRSVYTALLKHSFREPTAKTTILNNGISHENLQKVFELPFNVTKDTKLTEFQLKIIHNILPTRSSLSRAGLTDSDTCLWCKKERHTLEHMFWECPSIQMFWTRFIAWWKSKCFQDIVLSKSNVLYGELKVMDNQNCLNYVLLVAKYHIFLSCIHEEAPNLEIFETLLKSKLIVIEAAENKSGKIIKTWKNFLCKLIKD